MNYPNQKFRKYRHEISRAAPFPNTPEWLCYFIVDLIDDCMVYDTPGVHFCGQTAFATKCRKNGIDEFVEFADMLCL